MRIKFKNFDKRTLSFQKIPSPFQVAPPLLPLNWGYISFDVTNSFYFSSLHFFLETTRLNCKLFRRLVEYKGFGANHLRKLQLLSSSWFTPSLLNCNHGHGDMVMKKRQKRLLLKWCTHTHCTQHPLQHATSALPVAAHECLIIKRHSFIEP